MSAVLKIQAKLQVLLQQCVVLLPHHRVSLQHQRESGQRGSQAAAVQNHNLKRKNSESEEDQKRKGHLPEPERGQEHQAEEAGGRGPVSELSAASPATPRHGGPSIPPGTAFQAPHCAQTGTPRCPAATTRDWPPGTMIGGWGRQLKKQGKDCVQPWPESNIPELMAKVKANKIQRCSTVARNMRAHVPNATKATWFTMKFLQKKYEIISSCLTPIPMPISRPSSSESLYDSILYKSEIERV